MVAKSLADSEAVKAMPDEQWALIFTNPRYTSENRHLHTEGGHAGHSGVLKVDEDLVAGTHHSTLSA